MECRKEEDKTTESNSNTLNSVQYYVLTIFNISVEYPNSMFLFSLLVNDDCSIHLSSKEQIVVSVTARRLKRLQKTGQIRLNALENEV